MLKETAKEYFRQFSKKILNALKSLFSENVTLQDWSTKAHSKTEVLSLNRKLFQSVKNINIVPIIETIYFRRVFCINFTDDRKGSTFFSVLV